MATLDLGKVVGTQWLHGTAIDKSNYQDAIVVNEGLPEKAAAGDMYLNTSTGDVFRISDPPPASDADAECGKADTAVAAICAVLTQDYYDNYDVEDLTNALIANMADLGWRGANGVTYDVGQVEDLAWTLFYMAGDFRDNNETQYLDTGKPGAPVKMTWEQVQFYIINYYAVSVEEAADQGYDWKPSSERVITPKMELTWICNLTGPAGESAYDVAVDAGYTGTEAEFYAALEALKDGPFLPLAGGILAGDFAVESTGQGDNKLEVSDKVYINRDLYGKNANFSGKVVVGGTFEVGSTSTFKASATFSSNVSVNYRLNVSGAATFNSNATVNGAFNALNKSYFTGSATFNNDVTIGGVDEAGTSHGKLTVYGSINAKNSFNSRNIKPVEANKFDLGTVELPFKAAFINKVYVAPGTDYSTPRARNISSGTAAIAAGSAPLANGDIYLQYE